MKIRNDESGQVLVLTLLSMAVLMGFLALAVDVGTLYNAKRRVQTAADAAAIAAAVSYNYTSGSASVVQSTAATAAGTAAGNNGIAPANTLTNSACTGAQLQSNCVSVYFGSSITNAYHNTSGYIEAVVSQPNPSFFINVLSGLTGGSGFGNVPVTANAVAGIVPTSACTHITDKADASTLVVKGNADINSTTCGIQIDSKSTSAMCIQGSGSIEAPYINIAGNQSSSGQCGKNSGSPVYPSSGQGSDPFNNMLGPTPASACNANNTFSGASYSADPGKYNPVTAADGTTSNVECFTGANVSISGTFGSSPSTNGDIFVFTNGVQLGGNTTVNGTMDIYNGSFTQTNQSLTINAPGSDNNASAKTLTYDSIAIMQPSTNLTACSGADASFKKTLITNSEPCLQLQFGSGYGTLKGYVYAPTSDLYLQDQGGQVQVAGIVAYNMYVNSDLQITNYDASNASSTKLTTIQLVE